MGKKITDKFVDKHLGSNELMSGKQLSLHKKAFKTELKEISIHDQFIKISVERQAYSVCVQDCYVVNNAVDIQAKDNAEIAQDFVNKQRMETKEYISLYGLNHDG
jgi:hypothetical protein